MGNRSSGQAPYSTDANLLHISYEGNALEDPWTAPDEMMFTRSVSPEQLHTSPHHNKGTRPKTVAVLDGRTLMFSHNHNALVEKCENLALSYFASWFVPLAYMRSCSCGRS